MKNTAFFLLVLTLVLGAGIATAQQRRRDPKTPKPVPTDGEPIAAATHQRAKDAALKYWESRILKCGADLWYTVEAHGLHIQVHELRGKPVVSYEPAINQRTKLDIMNGIESIGFIHTTPVIKRYFDNSGLFNKNYKEEAFPGMQISIVNGKIVMRENDILDKLFTLRDTEHLGSGIRSRWNRPHSCEDIKTFIANKEPALSKTFLCLKYGGKDCLSKFPDISSIREADLEDSGSPRISIGSLESTPSRPTSSLPEPKNQDRMAESFATTLIEDWIFTRCGSNDNSYTLLGTNALLEVESVGYEIKNVKYEDPSKAELAKSRRAVMITGSRYRLHTENKDFIVSGQPILQVAVDVISSSEPKVLSIVWFPNRSVIQSLKKPTSCGEVEKFKASIGETK